jgi:hypothetical protein
MSIKRWLSSPQISSLFPHHQHPHPTIQPSNTSLKAPIKLSKTSLTPQSQPIKMQFSTVVSILSMAIFATAAPSIQARTGGGDGGEGGSSQCNASGEKQVCCVGGGVIALLCTVTALGSACGNEAYCCQTSSSVVSSSCSRTPIPGSSNGMLTNAGLRRQHQRPQLRQHRLNLSRAACSLLPLKTRHQGNLQARTHLTRQPEAGLSLTDLTPWTLQLLVPGCPFCLLDVLEDGVRKFLETSRERVLVERAWFLQQFDLYWRVFPGGIQ